MEKVKIYETVREGLHTTGPIKRVQETVTLQKTVGEGLHTTGIIERVQVTVTISKTVAEGLHTTGIIERKQVHRDELVLNQNVNRKKKKVTNFLISRVQLSS